MSMCADLSRFVCVFAFALDGHVCTSVSDTPIKKCVRVTLVIALVSQHVMCVFWYGCACGSISSTRAVLAPRVCVCACVRA